MQEKDDRNPGHFLGIKAHQFQETLLPSDGDAEGRFRKTKQPIYQLNKKPGAWNQHWTICHCNGEKFG